jgi:hypothetical protein
MMLLGAVVNKGVEATDKTGFALPVKPSPPPQAVSAQAAINITKPFKAFETRPGLQKRFIFSPKKFREFAYRCKQTFNFFEFEDWAKSSVDSSHQVVAYP